MIRTGYGRSAAALSPRILSGIASEHRGRSLQFRGTGKTV